MPKTIENYAPSIAVRRFAFVVWSLTALITFVWLGLILAPPLLLDAGFEQTAQGIYAAFGYVCHQIAERAFHIHEHPLAVCARCFGIYAGLGVGILAYPLFRSVANTQPLPRVLLLLAPIPTTVDWALGVFNIWENTHSSRFATGALLGVVCAFFVVPGLIEISRFLFLKNKKSAVAPPHQPKPPAAPSDYRRPDLRI